MSVEISLDRRRFLAKAVITIGAAELSIVGCANAESPAAVRLYLRASFRSLAAQQRGSIRSP